MLWQKEALMEQNEILDGLRQAVIDGEREAAERWANSAVHERMDPILAIEEGVRKGLGVIGDAFHREEIFLPELVRVGEVAMAVSAILEKELEKTNARVPTYGVMVIGTVAGDLHDLGKNLVSILFKTAGFSVIDLGIDVPTERFADAVKEYKPHILGLSSLLSTTVNEQKVVIDAISKAGLRSQVKVMVGGGVVTQDWADEIGADGYGEDAQEALEIGRKLLGLQ
jgi:5-methyltetrahydrofolate--homocysteine methyltransferase